MQQRSAGNINSGTAVVLEGGRLRAHASPGIAAHPSLAAGGAGLGRRPIFGHLCLANIRLAALDLFGGLVGRQEGWRQLQAGTSERAAQCDAAPRASTRGALAGPTWMVR